MSSCFTTVGSTSFSSLVRSVLTERSLACLASQGFRTLIVQYGKSELPPGWVGGTRVVELGELGEIVVELWDFKDGIEQVVAKADLVISHAGKALVVVFCILLALGANPMDGSQGRGLF